MSPAWAELRQRAGHRGPLRDEVDMAGASRGEERLQRAITHHLEEEERAQLYSAFHSFAAHGYETPGMGLG